MAAKGPSYLGSSIAKLLFSTLFAITALFVNEWCDSISGM
jgi:hypothetical protein